MDKIKIDDNFGSNQLLKDIAPTSHMIDIRVRYDGAYYWFEGNFLKDVLKHVDFKLIEKEFKAELSNHKQIDD